MPNIRVKAVPERVVRESPRGPMIPSDRFVSVPATPYIMRLIEVHGDLLVEPSPVKVVSSKAKWPDERVETPTEPAKKE